jgi:hypothetical protein
MNLRERLEIRALVNLIISVIERLVNILIIFMPKTGPDKNIPDIKPKPHRPRPLKRLVDIIPVPWKNKNE